MKKIRAIRAIRGSKEKREFMMNLWSIHALDRAVAANLSKISAAVGGLEVKDVWMRHRSDEQMHYIFKLTDHISLEVMSPLMEGSEGEFYSVYYDGECQHMGAASIDNIVDEMKKLKDLQG